MVVTKTSNKWNNFVTGFSTGLPLMFHLLLQGRNRPPSSRRRQMAPRPTVLRGAYSPRLTVRRAGLTAAVQSALDPEPRPRLEPSGDVSRRGWSRLPRLRPGLRSRRSGCPSHEEPAPSLANGPLDGKPLSRPGSTCEAPGQPP